MKAMLFFTKTFFASGVFLSVCLFLKHSQAGDSSSSSSLFFRLAMTLGCLVLGALVAFIDTRNFNKRSDNMKSKILFLIICSLALSSFAMAQDSRYYVQEKRPEIREGNTHYLVILVKDISGSNTLSNLRINNKRLQVEASSKTYDYIIAGQYYSISELQGVGLVLNAEQPEQDAKKPVILTDAEKALAQKYRNIISFSKNITLGGKVVTRDDIKKLKTLISEFYDLKQRAEMYSELDASRVESDDINFGMVNELSNALKSYGLDNKTYGDKKGLVKQALKKATGQEPQSVQKAGWARVYLVVGAGLGLIIAGGAWLITALLLSINSYDPDPPEVAYVVAIIAFVAWMLVAHFRLI